MIIDKIKMSFVNLETGIETKIIDLSIKENKNLDTEIDKEAIEKLLETFKEWVQKGKNMYLQDNELMVIFNSLEIGKKGFFRFELIEKKFLTENDL